MIVLTKFIIVEEKREGIKSRREKSSQRIEIRVWVRNGHLLMDDEEEERKKKKSERRFICVLSIAATSAD